MRSVSRIPSKTGGKVRLDDGKFGKFSVRLDFGTSLHSSQTCPRRSGLANNHEQTQSCLQSAFIWRMSDDGFADDLDLFLDLDLSSLALPWDEFVDDLARIRTEFSWAPEVVFCSIQLQILDNYAKDDVRLYRRAETSRKWRDAARANLNRCITELQKKLPNFLPYRGNAKAWLEQIGKANSRKRRQDLKKIGLRSIIFLAPRHKFGGEGVAVR
jgi:hypothetical protein